MDIWITECRKTVKACSHCGEPIELGEPMVCGKIWKKYTEEGGEPRRWMKNLRWHAQRKRDSQCCWLKQGLENIELHPIVETRGRKKIMLPKPARMQRLKLLRKRARTVARLKELMEIPLEQLSAEDASVIVSIGSSIEEMKLEIENLGGVPKSWE